MYPNPATDIFTAQFSLPAGAKAKIKLLNLLGELLSFETFMVTQDVETVNMDISDIENGIYYVVVETAEYSKTQKLVIAR